MPFDGSSGGGLIWVGSKLLLLLDILWWTTICGFTWLGADGPYGGIHNLHFAQHVTHGRYFVAVVVIQQGLQCCVVIQQVP